MQRCNIITGLFAFVCILALAAPSPAALIFQGSTFTAIYQSDSPTFQIILSAEVIRMLSQTDKAQARLISNSQLEAMVCSCAGHCRSILFTESNAISDTSFKNIIDIGTTLTLSSLKQ